MLIYVELVRNVCTFGATSTIRKVASLGHLHADVLLALDSLPTASTRLRAAPIREGYDLRKCGGGDNILRGGDNILRGGDNILRGGDNTAGVTDNTSGVGDNHSGGMENKSGVTDDSINFKSMQHGKDVSPDKFNGSLFSLVVFKQLEKGMIIILSSVPLIAIL